LLIIVYSTIFLFIFVKKIMRYFIVFSLVCFCIGCKTSFRISVMNPAFISLPEEVTKIGVVNHVNDQNSPEKVLGNILTGQQNGNVMASERAVSGVLRAIDDSGYLTGEVIENSVEMRTSDGEINWDFLDRLREERGIGAIVEMAELRTTSPVGQAIITNASGRRTARIEGNLDFNYYIIPSREKHEGYWVRRFYSIHMNQTQSIIGVMDDMRRKQEHYRALGWNLGYGGGRLIYHHWIWVNRKYYNKGSGNLRRSKRMIRAGNWNIAEQQLLPDFDHRSRKVRGRTLYNLALVREGQGDLDGAIDFAEKAAITLGNKLANEYLQTLRFRKAQLAEF
jgi:hypothetical protein